LTAFALWLLGNVVAPDAYQRTVNHLKSRTAEGQLAKCVGEQVGPYPKRVFRRWYRTEKTWYALVEGGQESFDSLVSSLVEASAGRWFRHEFRPDEAEDIVRAVVGGFMKTLAPSDAVAVADYRSSERDAVLDANAESRMSQVLSRFDDIDQRLDATIDFDARVAQLPQPARRSMAGLGASREAMWLLDIAEAEIPREAFVQLVADIPAWLSGATGPVLVAAAELCRCYGVHLGAGRLFELAADISADRAYCYARAALEFETVGDSDRRRQLIERATSLGADSRVEAIAAALDEQPSRVLKLVSEQDALSEPFLIILRLYALHEADSIDEVIALLDLALEQAPEAAGLMVELARAKLLKSRLPTSIGRHDYQSSALELSLQARGLFREWRADASRAVLLACEAAFMRRQYARVVEIGTAPPDGEALPTEASNTEVRLAVAEAAIASGNTHLAQRVISHVPQGFQRAIIEAELLAQTSANPNTLQSAFDAVWTEAKEQEPEHQRLYWLAASSAGVELRGLDVLAARADDLSVIVEAQLHSARGDHNAALAMLRRGQQSELTTQLLVDALVGNDDIDGAVDQLTAAATRFNDTRHLVHGVDLYVRNGRHSAAASLARNALLLVPSTLREERAFLHQVLVERAGTEGAWREMAVRARAWIEDLGSQPTNRWHLALALNNSTDVAGSWRVLQESPILNPTTAQEARLWTFLASRESPGPSTADRIISLVDAYPTDTELISLAINGFFAQGDVWGAVSPNTIGRFQRLLTDHSAEYGSNEEAAAFVLGGTAQEMIEQLRPSLERRARLLNDRAEKVRHGWPYGLLALEADRPYALTLIYRAVGCLPIATIDIDRVRAELVAARAGLNQRVALDLSSLVVGSYIKDVWPVLRGHFARIDLPQPALSDILSTVAFLEREATGSLSFDTAAQAIRIYATDAATTAQLLEQGQWAASQTAELSIVDWPHLGELGDLIDDRHLPWLAALDVAKSQGIPLWCDDLGLRTLAADFGVPSFGTASLIRALVDSADIDGAFGQTALRRLRDEYAVDLPLDSEWLRFSAAIDQWKPGPSQYFFSRKAAWANAQITNSLWSELVQSAAFVEPVRVVGWVEAASHGVIRATTPLDAPKALASLAARAIAITGFDPETLGRCAATIREVGRAAGIVNPVPILIANLLEHLKTAVGAGAAAKLLLSAHLVDEDRSVVRDLVFGA
jgi:hypothetical protein